MFDTLLNNKPAPVETVQTIAAEYSIALHRIAGGKQRLESGRVEAQIALDAVKDTPELMKISLVNELVTALMNVQDYEYELKAMETLAAEREKELRELVEANAVQLLLAINDGKTILRGKDKKVAINISTTYQDETWDAVRAYNWCAANPALSRYVIHTVDEKALKEAIRTDKVIVPEEYSDVYAWSTKHTARLTKENFE